MKIKGQHLIDFFKAWPPGEDVYYDDFPFTEGAIPGSEETRLCEADDVGNPGVPADPAATYTIDCGMLGWQGKGPVPEGFNDDLVSVIRKWVKAAK